MSSVDTQTTVEPPPAAGAVNGREAGTCANCGAALQGVYCGACGQRDEPLRQPIGRFLKEAFIEFFGVDGRVWQSLGLLLFRPGQLTEAYLTGQRVRYLRPLRLYLTASLLFFLMLSIIDPVGQVDFGDEAVPADTTVRAADYRATIDSLLAVNAGRLAAPQARVDSLETKFIADSLALEADRLTLADDALEEREEALDDLLDDRDDERDDLEALRQRVAAEQRRLTWVRQQIAAAPPDSLIRPADLERAAELLVAPRGRVNLNLPDWWPQSDAVRQMRAARTGKEMKAALAAFLREVLGRLPTVMFLLLPVFALLLKLLYVRRGWYYSEHLVFGLHTHAFAFLLFTVMLLLVWASGGAVWAEVTANLLSLVIVLYFYMAQKRVYGQGWIKTALKVWMLGWMYFFVLIGGLVLVLVLATAL